MKNMMDLDRERWVRVASIKKGNIIWACDEENRQRPRNAQAVESQPEALRIKNVVGGGNVVWKHIMKGVWSAEQG